MSISLTPELISRLYDVNKTFLAQTVSKGDDNAKNILFQVDDKGALVIAGRSSSMAFSFSPSSSLYKANGAIRFVITTDNLNKALASFARVDDDTVIDTQSETHLVFAAPRKKMKLDRQRVDSEFALPKKFSVPEGDTSTLGSCVEFSKAFAIVKGNRYKEDFAADSVFAGVLVDLSPEGAAVFAANTSSIAQATTEKYDPGKAFDSKIMDPRLVPALMSAMDPSEPVELALTGQELVAGQDSGGSTLVVSVALLNFAAESMRRPRLLEQAKAMIAATDVHLNADGKELVTSMQEAGSIDRASNDAVRLSFGGDKIVVQSVTRGVYGAEIAGTVKKKDTAPNKFTVEIGSSNLKSMVSKKADSLLRLKSSEVKGSKVPVVLIGDDDGDPDQDVTRGWFLIETGVTK